MAYTEDGRLFARFHGQMMESDRRKSVWKHVETQQPERGLFMGAEGNEMVYAESGGLRMVWTRP